MDNHQRLLIGLSRFRIKPGSTNRCSVVPNSRAFARREHQLIGNHVEQTTDADTGFAVYASEDFAKIVSEEQLIRLRFSELGQQGLVGCPVGCQFGYFRQIGPRSAVIGLLCQSIWPRVDPPTEANWRKSGCRAIDRRIARQLSTQN